eukprot:1159420-Pelagomonas_calceolata.AAC.14
MMDWFPGQPFVLRGSIRGACWQGASITMDVGTEGTTSARSTLLQAVAPDLAQSCGQTQSFY